VVKEPAHAYDAAHTSLHTPTMLHTHAYDAAHTSLHTPTMLHMCAIRPRVRLLFRVKPNATAEVSPCVSTHTSQALRNRDGAAKWCCLVTIPHCLTQPQYNNIVQFCTILYDFVTIPHCLTVSLDITRFVRFCNNTSLPITQPQYNENCTILYDFVTIPHCLTQPHYNKICQSSIDDFNGDKSPLWRRKFEFTLCESQGK